MNKKVLMICLGVLVIGLVILYLVFFKTYKVTFTLKIGAGIETQEVKKNELVKEPVVPEFAGYKFIGWYLDGKLYDFNTPVTKNINLEARWEKNEDKSLQ